MRDGLTKRGDAQRKTKKKQGPLTAQCLADNISKLPTPQSYEGCGKLTQTRRVKVKGQPEVATEEYYVYGWKVLVLIEVQWCASGSSLMGMAKKRPSNVCAPNWSGYQP